MMTAEHAQSITSTEGSGSINRRHSGAYIDGFQNTAEGLGSLAPAKHPAPQASTPLHDLLLSTQSQSFVALPPFALQQAARQGLQKLGAVPSLALLPVAEGGMSLPSSAAQQAQSDPDAPRVPPGLAHRAAAQALITFPVQLHDVEFGTGVMAHCEKRCTRAATTWALGSTRDPGSATQVRLMAVDKVTASGADDPSSPGS